MAISTQEELWLISSFANSQRKRPPLPENGNTPMQGRPEPICKRIVCARTGHGNGMREQGPKIASVLLVETLQGSAQCLSVATAQPNVELTTRRSLGPG